MAGNPKIYNVQYLARYTTLDTVEGLNNCGSSRQVYFDKISDFVEKTTSLLPDLIESRPKKETLADLFSLQTLLLGVCETQIIEQVEDLMLTVRRDRDKKAIGDGLYTVWSNLSRLCQRIRDSVIAPEPGAPSPQNVGAETSDLQKSKKVKIPISTSLFTRLSTLLEEFDFKTAAEEVESLKGFSFDEEINRIIISISDSLEESDYKVANAKVKHLIKRAEEKEKAAAPPPPAKKTILAIDDMPDILATIRNMLKGQFNVYCVPNHLDALRFVAGNTPDLILLDIEMPDMDGFSLLKILRQIEECKNVPVIFLTGNVSVENVKASVLSGGNDFIKKPVEYNLLVSKINRQLEMVKK